MRNIPRWHRCNSTLRKRQPPCQRPQRNMACLRCRSGRAPGRGGKCRKVEKGGPEDEQRWVDPMALALMKGPAEGRKKESAEKSKGNGQWTDHEWQDWMESGWSKSVGGGNQRKKGGGYSHESGL